MPQYVFGLKKLNYSVSIPGRKKNTFLRQELSTEIRDRDVCFGRGPNSPKGMPSRKLTNSTKREQENYRLNSALLGRGYDGYVSSQEVSFLSSMVKV